MTDDRTIYTMSADELRALPDAEFNAVVARAQGYTVRNLGGNEPGAGYWHLLGPDGNIYRNIYPVARYYEDGHWHITRGYAQTEAEAWSGVPSYASDLNAAWALCAGNRPHIVETWDGEIQAAVMLTQEGSVYCETHANPARALVLAWVMWRREQGE